jgi:hypothetical protein
MSKKAIINKHGDDGPKSWIKPIIITVLGGLILAGLLFSIKSLSSIYHPNVKENTQYEHAKDDVQIDNKITAAKHTSPHISRNTHTSKQDSPASLTQSMINSPGGIQAGRDVVIASDRRLIQSVRLYITVESETPATAVTEPGVDVGLGSVVALFTKDNTRLRFSSDFKIKDHQMTPHLRQLSFVYDPETPNEILGKPVDFLGAIDALVVNYAEIFKLERFDTQNEHTSLILTVVVNGITVAKVAASANPPGTLSRGQATLSVADAFSVIPSVYNATVSK